VSISNAKIPVASGGQGGSGAGGEGDAGPQQLGNGDVTAMLIGAAASVKQRRVPLHLVALAGVLCASTVMLYGMRYMGLGPKASIASEMPELKLPDTKGRSAQQKAVLNDLAGGHAGRQVPLEQIKANPFVLQGKAMPAPAATQAAGGNGRDDERRRQDERKKQEEDWKRNVAADFEALRLNALMGGNPPRARVNGDLKTIGDRAGKFFTIKSISGRSIELQDDGNRIFTLELSK